MTRRIVLCLSHSIEEHDMLKLLSGIGHDVFSIGGYINPGAPHDDKRPALPGVPAHPELQRAVDELGTPDNLGAAQHRIPDAVLAWADTIIFHHYLERLFGDWPRIKDWLRGDPNRRVIWRSVGQSVEGNERTALPFRKDGLERVAYSPKEQNIPGYSGHDALIRFYADPDEWKGWTGDIATVLNITQHLKQRDPYTNWGFWEAATRGLPRTPVGPGSEAIDGLGAVPYDWAPDVGPTKPIRGSMKELLRRCRVYLYTGTQPASYTLGLIEAMMTGIPMLSITPSHMRIWPYSPDLFEGFEIIHEDNDLDTVAVWSDPEHTRTWLRVLLNDPQPEYSAAQRNRAIDLFGKDKIAAEWAAFLA